MLVHHQNQHTAVVCLWQRSPRPLQRRQCWVTRNGHEKIMAAISGSSALCMPELQACQTSCIANKHLRIRTGMKWNFSRTIGSEKPRKNSTCDSTMHVESVEGSFVDFEPTHQRFCRVRLRPKEGRGPGWQGEMLPLPEP